MWNGAVTDAKADVGNIASILAQQTSQSVKAIDLVLEDLAARIDLMEVTTPEDLRNKLYSEQEYSHLMARLARLPQVQVIGIIDAEGDMLLSTRGWPTPPLHVAGRNPFDYLKTHHDLGLSVGAPIKSDVSGTWTVYFHRRVENSAGEFLGTVAAGVSPSFFIGISEGASAVGQVSARLLRDDGTIYVTNPETGSGPGQAAENDATWFDLVGRGGGSYRRSAGPDGDPQYVAVVPVADYPLVVDVGRSEASVAAVWRARVLPIAAASALLTLLMAVLTGFLLVQFNRALERQTQLRERDERLVHEARERHVTTARFEAALTHMRQGLAVFDADSRLVVCNANYATMYGIPPERLPPGTPFGDILALRVANGTYAGSDPAAYVKRHIGFVEAMPGDFSEVEQLRDGRFIRSSKQAMPDGGWLTIHEDVTERETAMAHLAHLASHDSLTGLANRSLLIDVLGDFERSGKATGAVGLLMVDLDGFKAVNDKFGHAIGDALLKSIATRLASSAGPRDTVARIGGDEFAVLRFSDHPDPHSLAAFGKALLQRLHEPFEIDRHVLKLGASIGIAPAMDGTLAPDTVLSRADLALYRAKSDGRNRVVAFEPEMETAILSRRELAADLDAALDAGAIEVHYQPIVDADSRSVLAMEALARWQHPRQGAITPAVFIPLAEETGQIFRLGELVLERACRNARSWPADVKIAVNVSPIQVAQDNFPDLVRRYLAKSGLPATRLEIELTESALLADYSRVRRTLEELRALGIRIVLDDFGTGFASLSNLNNFAVDKIKVDRSFISQLGGHKGSTAIVEASTMIADAFDVMVTAEGVETQEQFRLLRRMGIVQLQGFLFGVPAPADAWRFEGGKAITRAGSLLATHSG
jgi:diguanylate cyclase (GGDEF)-like protein